jgi:tRNA (guanine37-N1)-methyltransferase
LSTIKIVTLFPDFFESPFSSGLMGKAIGSGILHIDIINLRDYSEDKFNRCDDYPYGGGSGMVLKPEPLFRCLDTIRYQNEKIIATTPGGIPLQQGLVKELSLEDDLIILCGHYEGIDQRVIEKYVDVEISIGDYILSGGEFAALVIVDTVARYQPGFMSNSESLCEESFENGLLEYPQYTRPAEYDAMPVPRVLLEGNHAKIKEWRFQKSLEKTKLMRPDLYKKFCEKQ